MHVNKIWKKKKINNNNYNMGSNLFLFILLLLLLPHQVEQEQGILSGAAREATVEVKLGISYISYIYLIHLPRLLIVFSGMGRFSTI